MLIKKGHKFKSQTDTEVIPHLIEEELKKYENPSEEDYINAVKDVIKKLDGTYALLILNKNFPNMLIGVRNESPLILGVKEDECFLGSDISAFLEWTKEAVPLEDGDMVVLRKNFGNNKNDDKENSKVVVSYTIYNNNEDITD